MEKKEDNVNELISEISALINNETFKEKVNPNIYKSLNDLYINCMQNLDNIDIPHLRNSLEGYKDIFEEQNTIKYSYVPNRKNNQRRKTQKKRKMHCTINNCGGVMEEKGNKYICPKCNCAIDKVYMNNTSKGIAEDPYDKCIKYCTFISGLAKLPIELYYFSNIVITELNNMAKLKINELDSNEDNKKERLDIFNENNIENNKTNIFKYYIKKYNDMFTYSNKFIKLDDLEKAGIEINYRKNESIDFNVDNKLLLIYIIKDIKVFRNVLKDIHHTICENIKSNNTILNMYNIKQNVYFRPQDYPYLQTIYRLIYRPTNMPIISPEDAKIIAERYIQFDQQFLSNTSNMLEDIKNKKNRTNRRKLSQIIKYIISKDENFNEKYGSIMIIDGTTITINNNEKLFKECFKE